MAATPDFSMGRYVGSKRRLLDFVAESLATYGVPLNRLRRVADLFAGTGAMAWWMANLPAVTHVWANDLEPYAACIVRARLSRVGAEPAQARLDGYTQKARARVKSASNAGGWVTRYHSKMRQGRQLYTRPQALHLDALSDIIPRSDVEGTAALLESALRHANTVSGLHTMVRRAGRPPCSNCEPTLKAVQPRGRTKGARVRVTCGDALLLRSDHEQDLVYLDPPYTGFSYSVHYHLLNTLLLKDDPQTKGINNVRASAGTTAFERKTSCEGAFRKLLAGLHTRYVCISYSTYAIVPLSDLKGLLEDCGFVGVRVFEASLPKYSAFGADAEVVTELLIVARASRAARARKR
jgi:adenine-specific DNA methylase